MADRKPLQQLDGHLFYQIVTLTGSLFHSVSPHDQRLKWLSDLIISGAHQLHVMLLLYKQTKNASTCLSLLFDPKLSNKVELCWIIYHYNHNDDLFLLSEFYYT